jgi:signal transduction histidine kinase
MPYKRVRVTWPGCALHPIGWFPDLVLGFKMLFASGRRRWVASEDGRGRFTKPVRLLPFFEASIVAPTLVGLAYVISRDGGRGVREVLPVLVLWVLIIGLVELIPVPVWRGVHISMGFPLLMVVAFLYPPEAASAAALLAASDPRELRHEVGLLRALFNRCQVALAVGSSSLIFHALASVDSSWPPVLLAAAGLASIADYVVNTTLVCIAASIHFWMSPFRVIRELKVGRLSEYLISYLGLAVFGVFLAKVFIIGESDNNWWAVPVFVLPLLLARQMFFRSKALEEAHKELQDREHVLRALSNRMAEERQDERLQIAAFLHDDLAQLLFRLSIQVDVARRHLGSGKVEDTEQLLLEIKDTKNRTSDRIRALIRDLHRSPLGRAGLGEAIRSFLAEMARESEVLFHADIEEVDVPAPIALLLYHNAREGVMNALKHAKATNIWITVNQQGDEVEMVLRDDGVGFDVEAPGPEGHYGMTMMRERATVGGGTFRIESAPGAGTTITLRFPTSWLQEEESQGQAQAESPAMPPAGASRGAVSTPPSSSTESIPA